MEVKTLDSIDVLGLTFLVTWIAEFMFSTIF